MVFKALVYKSTAFFVKDAFVVKEIIDVSASISKQEIAAGYPHLKNLRFPLLKNSKVELLLGTDLHHACTCIEMFLWVSLVNCLVCTLH